MSSTKGKAGQRKSATKATTPGKSSQAAKSKKIEPQTKQNGAGINEPSASDFLYTGKSPQELEDDWIQKIGQLLKRKKTVSTADQFTETLRELYDDLLKELCYRCGEKFKPIFNTEEDAQSDAGVQTKQTPRDNYDEKSLLDKLTESASKLNDLKEEKEKIGQELSHSKEVTLNYEKRVTEYSKKIDEMMDENKQLNSKLTEIRKKCLELEAQQQETSKSVDVIDKKELQVRLSNQDKMLKQDKESIDKLKRENEDLLKQIDGTQSSLKDAENNVAKLSKENEKHRVVLEEQTTKRKALENEKSDLQKKLENSISSIDKLKSENLSQGKTDSSNREQIDRLLGENERLKVKEKELTTQIVNKEKEIQKLHEHVNILKAEKESLETVVAQIKNQLEEEKNKVKKEKKFASKAPDQKVKELQDENDKLRDRLSQIAGSKLTQGNPAIADLGDPNRPTLLGEKFSELYDNEWTDAMEELGGNDEKSNINTLKTIVEKAYEFGKTRAANFAKGVEKALLELSNSIEVSDVIAKYIKDHRKNISLHVTDGLYKSFIGSHTEYNIGGEGVKNFIKKSVSLCWLMAIQDPSVILTTKISGKFDTDRFRHYTKSGSTVDYVVWPVVFLHEGGPIICKGVAQGK